MIGVGLGLTRTGKCVPANSVVDDTFIADFENGFYALQADPNAVDISQVVTVNRASGKTLPDGAGGWPTFDIDDPALTDLGLSIEQDTTNEAIHSNLISNSWWLDQGVSSFDTALAPDGSMTALKCTSTDNSPILRLRRDGLGGAATTRTLSVYAKSDDIGYLALQPEVGTVGVMMFDLSTGERPPSNSFNINPTIVDYGSEPAANGFRRYWATFKDLTSRNAGTRIEAVNRPQGPSGGPRFDGVQSVTLWQANFVTGQGVSSAIATTGTTQTRAADIVTVNNLILNPTAGTFIVKHTAAHLAPLLAFDGDLAFMRAFGGETVLTYDATSTTVYADGGFVARTGPLSIGTILRLGQDSAGHCNAQIGALRYISRAMSGEEVFARYNYPTGSSATLANLVAGGQS